MVTDFEQPVSVSDMETWVQRHGRKRFNQALLEGYFRGASLRAAREWLAFKNEQRRRGVVLLMLAVGVVLALTAFVYVGPL